MFNSFKIGYLLIFISHSTFMHAGFMRKFVPAFKEVSVIFYSLALWYNTARHVAEILMNGHS